MTRDLDRPEGGSAHSAASRPTQLPRHAEGPLSVTTNPTLSSADAGASETAPPDSPPADTVSTGRSNRAEASIANLPNNSESPGTHTDLPPGSPVFSVPDRARRFTSGSPENLPITSAEKDDVPCWDLPRVVREWNTCDLFSFRAPWRSGYGSISVLDVVRYFISRGGRRCDTCTKHKLELCVVVDGGVCVADRVLSTKARCSAVRPTTVARVGPAPKGLGMGDDISHRFAEVESRAGFRLSQTLGKPDNPFKDLESPGRPAELSKLGSDAGRTRLPDRRDTSKQVGSQSGPLKSSSAGSSSALPHGDLPQDAHVIPPGGPRKGAKRARDSRTPQRPAKRARITGPQASGTESLPSPPGSREGSMHASMAAHRQARLKPANRNPAPTTPQAALYAAAIAAINEHFPGCF